MNKSKKLSIAAVSVISLVFSISVFAGGETGRYHISGSGFGLDVARAVVGESHREFDNGFTGDLSPGQVKALEVLGLGFGVSVEPVALYHIVQRSGGGDTTVTRTYTPFDQTPWGIEKMYGNGSITSTSGGLGVDVAVLDTGVYKGHLDLKNKVKQCKDFTPARGIRDGSCVDKNGHGTHVAGTILADGGTDGRGIYGMAPQANLFAYKVCGNSGSCWADDIAAAIRTAADQGAEIISMSLGSNSASSFITNAVNYAVSKGVLIVAAAGNDGPADGSIDYPGAYVGVVAVGAIDVNENVPSWSSRGVNDGDYIVEAREVEFGAPGVSVESTWKDGGYYTISGTSMATPHVSGLAAKLWQGSAASTRTYLQNAARDIWTFGDDTATGFGLSYVR